jgi:hypothetical protein
VAVEQHGGPEHVGVEHARQRPDRFGEVDQPIVVGPRVDLGVDLEAEQEVGRLPRLDCGLNLVRQIGLLVKDQLDLLAGLLLERGDGLPNGLILVGIEALLPPDYEVSALGSERRHGERCGENNGLPAHDVASHATSRALINPGRAWAHGAKEASVGVSPLIAE